MITKQEKGCQKKFLSEQEISGTVHGPFFILLGTQNTVVGGTVT